MVVIAIWIAVYLVSLAQLILCDAALCINIGFVKFGVYIGFLSSFLREHNNCDDIEISIEKKNVCNVYNTLHTLLFFNYEIIYMKNFMTNGKILDLSFRSIAIMAHLTLIFKSIAIGIFQFC